MNKILFSNEQILISFNSNFDFNSNQDSFYTLESNRNLHLFKFLSKIVFNNSLTNEHTFFEPELCFLKIRANESVELNREEERFY